MVRREPANPAVASHSVDDAFCPGPPSIRTTGEIPAVTGEVRPRPVQPRVPEFNDRSSDGPDLAVGSPGTADPEAPPGHPPAPVPGGTVVDFPPTSAPGRAPGGPAAPVAGAVPVPESPRATGPRPGGRPWAPSIAGAVEIGRQTPGVAPEVFATETSVFPAVRTRRGDIFVDDRGMASTADGPLPTGPSLPPIRIDEGDDLLAEEERRIRRLRIGLLVAGLVVAAAIIALGSALGLGLA